MEMKRIIESGVRGSKTECSCCYRRRAHLQLVEGYQQGVTGALKQNTTTEDNNESEDDFGGRSRVGQ